MIFILTDNDFKKIFKGTKFNLPIRWDGKDFVKNLKKLFDDYLRNILVFFANVKSSEIKKIEEEFSFEDESFLKKIEYCIKKRGNVCLDVGKNCYIYEYEYTQIYDEYLLAMKKHYKRLLINDKLHYFCQIKISCHLIISAIKSYLNGLPADAYDYMNLLMRNIIHEPIKDFYNKETSNGAFNGNLKLYRVTSVDENINQPRKRIFHPPYDMCTKISTNRYSIAGFPSLYLGTSLELCMEEINDNSYSKLICSRFEVPRDSSNIVIKVLELGIKPQDFIKDEGLNETNFKNIRLKHLRWILDDHVRGTYLLWYPLIAACSYIRAFRKDPFAPEYIIPQLLMQWLRKYNNEENSKNEFFGLRYFSCHSEKSSDLGFNYVFPTSGEHDKNSKYCKLLGKSFILSKPIYFHNFNSIEDCELALNNDIDLKHIFS